MRETERSILFVQNLDLASPLGCTVPYYLTAKLAEDHEVHAICRERAARREAGSPPEGCRLYAINTGEVPVISGLLFVVLSTVYAAILGVRHRYDAVVAFQNELIQGWVGAVAASGAFVAQLQSVPVRQGRDFRAEADDDVTARDRISQALTAAYAVVVGRLLRRADEVISLTHGIRELTAETYDVDLSDAHVIGMGIDTERFGPAGSETYSGGPVIDGAGATAPDRQGSGSQRNREGEPSTDSDTPWTLVYVGTIRATRGIDDVIEAVAATDHDVELRIAGTGPDEHVASLRRLAADLGLADRVDWLGLIPHDEVPDLLRKADVAVSPLPDIESYRVSYPAKLLEYMAAECLVVATDIQPHRLLIEDGENGYLYEPGVDGFRRALDRCLDAVEDHDRVREAARAAAKEREWDSVVARHERAIFGHAAANDPALRPTT